MSEGIEREKGKDMEKVDPVYLRPTAIIDSDHPTIIEFAQKAADGIQDPVDQAISIYLAVRDGIRYDPYSPFYRPEHYRASNVLKIGRGYCVCKASLLCALGRSLGIPSRVGFATVRNHLATKQLLERQGSDLFVYHGYTEFLGTYADIPVEIIVSGWEKAYGREKVQAWIREMEEAQGKTIWNFYQEDVV